MAFLAGCSLVTLGIGALASPGRRGREVGIVLITASSWTAVTGLAPLVLLLDRAFRALLPDPEALEQFTDRIFGTLFTAAMFGLGLPLVRRAPRAEKQ